MPFRPKQQCFELLSRAVAVQLQRVKDSLKSSRAKIHSVIFIYTWFLEFALKTCILPFWHTRLWKENNWNRRWASYVHVRKAAQYVPLSTSSVVEQNATVTHFTILHITNECLGHAGGNFERIKLLTMNGGMEGELGIVEYFQFLRHT